MTKLFVATLLAVLLAFPGTRAASAAAPASPWAETAHGAVRLIAAAEATGDAGAVVIGMQFRMNPGWHVYWRSPGDAGYPPRADWSASHNLASAVTHWPAPHRFTVLDLQTIGYAERVLLPVDVRLEHPGEALALRATIDYLTCADICVPYVADLALDLPAGPAAPSAFAHDLARARAAVPGDGAAHGLALEQVVLTDRPGEPVVAVDLRADQPLDTPDVFLEAAPPIVFGAPERALSQDRLRARLLIPVFNSEGSSRPLNGLAVTVTVVDGDRAMEQSTAVRAASPAAPVATATVTAATAELLPILALALLGGLILNLMPCVLPVLSMKLLAVVRHGGGDRRTVRAGFVAAALGIGFSFMLLAGALIALRTAGAAVGWGLQFQQPWFLTAMILVVTLFACNLWGLFEVPMPQVLGLADERAGRIRGLAGHFLTGALATLLATPCSAPFLGTAVGFALARGPAEIVMVFACVAIGLALPYLAVAAFPALATRLPKPGRWMNGLRRLLGLALAITAVWLAWVLAARIGTPGALLVGGLAAAIVVVLAARRRLPDGLRPAGAVAMLALALAAFVLPPGAAAVRAGPTEAGLWQRFEPARIPALVADGRTVFVNVTADWCITCKVNERLVLSRDPVRARLTDDRVVAMQGDWTAPDDGIARYLAGFGRYGIPFDAVYGPARPQGQALPELLSEDAVIDALDRAQGDRRAAGR